MPTPADTSDTASARCLSNQPVTAAIIGAKNALVATPTRTPNVSWNCARVSARLASTSARPRIVEPIKTTTRGPHRSLAIPHANEPRPMAMKLSDIALEMPARPQPVSTDIGSRNTASENMAPTATQPMRPPRATRVHPYLDSIGYFLRSARPTASSPPSRLAAGRFDTSRQLTLTCVIAYLN